MISSSTAAASTVAIVLALSVAIDPQHRLRNDRVDSQKHVIWRTRDRIVSAIGQKLEKGATYVFKSHRSKPGEENHGEDGVNGERRPLLG